MIRFGPSGNSNAFYEQGHKSTTEAPAWCAAQGLNAYEYSFGRGINVSDKKANEIGAEGKKHDVAISVHAPYYINFANPSDEMAQKSVGYVINSALKAKQFYGDRVVFHPSTVGKMSRAEAVALTEKRLVWLAEEIRAAHLDDVWFCPETMGKINQIGDVEEITRFCKIADFYLPAIDFGHVNARTYGSLKSAEDFENLLLQVINALGQERASKMHVHFSKIEYSQGGEVRHLTFADTVFGPEFAPLAKMLVKYKLEPVIICESDGTQSQDAVAMKNEYQRILSEEAL